MDPISLTASALTFVTAIKDIIQLAQAIQSSVKKVPQNRKAIRKLAEDVLSGLNELESFCKSRTQLLEGSEELKVALDKLATSLRTTHQRCCELFPPDSPNAFRKALNALNAWRKCDEIEADILTLKDEVQACYTRFTAFAVARLETPIVNIASSTAQIKDSLLVLTEQQKDGLRHIEGVVAKLQITNTHSELTLRPTKAMDARTSAPTIPQEEIANMYLRQQIEAISSSLNNLQPRSIFVDENPDGVDYVEYKAALLFPPAGTESDTREAFHRQTVEGALQTVRLLQSTPSTLSIPLGAANLSKLSLRLYMLNMDSDALLVGLWAVELYRLLYKQRPMAFGTRLAVALCNLTKFYSTLGDTEKARIVVEEAVSLQKVMLGPGSRYTRLQLASTLVEHWYLLIGVYDSSRALEVIKESLDLLDGINAEIQDWKDLMQSKQPTDPAAMTGSRATPVTTESSLADKQSDGADPSADEESFLLSVQYTTCMAVYASSITLLDLKRYSEGYEMAKRVLDATTRLYERYPDKFMVMLAHSLYRITRPPLSTTSVATEKDDDRRKYKERAVDLYISYSQIKGPVSGVSAVRIVKNHMTLLWELGRLEEAKKVELEVLDMIRRGKQGLAVLRDLVAEFWALRALGMDEETLAVCHEILEICSPHVAAAKQGQLLDELKIIARTLFVVSLDLGRLGQDETFAVSADAFECYQRWKENSSRKDNGRAENTEEKTDLAKGLVYYATMLNHFKRYDDALAVGAEAVRKYRDVVDAIPEHIEDGDAEASQRISEFTKALTEASTSAMYCRDPRDLEVSYLVLDELRHLLSLKDDDSIKCHLVSILQHHEYVLGKHYMFSDGLVVMEEAVKVQRQLPTNSVNTAISRNDVLNAYARNLASFGRLQEALQVLEEAIDSDADLDGDSENVQNFQGLATLLADAYSQKAYYLCNLDKKAEALEWSTESIAILFDTCFPDDDTLTGTFLLRHAICLQKNGELPEALSRAREAIGYCRHPKAASVHPLTRARLPDVLAESAMIFAESGNLQEGIEMAKEAMDLFRACKADRKKDGTLHKQALPWAFFEEEYSTCLMNYAFLRVLNILKAGTLSSAPRTLLNEIEADFKEAKTHLLRRSSNLPQSNCLLAVVLEMYSLFLCVVGRVEEAKAMAKDLDERRKRLEAFQPELADAVSVELKDLRARPLMMAFASHPHVQDLRRAYPV